MDVLVVKVWLSDLYVGPGVCQRHELEIIFGISTVILLWLLLLLTVILVCAN